MPAPTNPLKAKLLAGETQIGAFLGMDSPVATEIAGRAGFDWCLVDAEHAPQSVDTVRGQLITLAAAGCPAAVRVAGGAPWMLKRALDVGAQTILVPMVDSAAEAEAAVRGVRYAPRGHRGLAAGIVRASGYGEIADYATTADDQICLMVQAESRAAVENIDAIAAVAGVDCVFIGPSDLAADMGHLGNTAAPEVHEAIAHVMARTRAAGKAVGMFCLDPAGLARYRDLGATFIAVGSDIVSFRKGMARAATEARAALG